MYNDLKNISSTINKLSKKDWKKLFDLIPEIEQTEDFIESGGWVETADNPEGFVIEPIIEKKIVWDLIDTLDKLDLLIAFNWVNWEEGRKIAFKKDFENRDTITLLKLISMFIRVNRFFDGELEGRFSDRSMERILKQIKKNVESKP